jgi:uncharacterized Fe-S cluster-containing MiaB family protein
MRSLVGRGSKRLAEVRREIDPETGNERIIHNCRICKSEKLRKVRSYSRGPNFYCHYICECEFEFGPVIYERTMNGRN